MTANRSGVLQLLKTELDFVKSGGYRRSLRSPWRPPYVFEESPSCPNYSSRARPHRCTDCWLMEFVPVDLRDEQVPCRFVQLTPEGVSVDSLYRYGTPAETDELLQHWLEERIRELEENISELLPFAANS